MQSHNPLKNTPVAAGEHRAQVNSIRGGASYATYGSKNTDKYDPNPMGLR